ncbi:putative membrane protein [Malaciobacter molluscorum LMG 25693]|nr:putative membrane protein [Malaciobacter molluscorum LMG 25693]
MHEALTAHIYAIYLFIIIMLFNFYSVINIDDFMKLARRLKFMTPLYHLTNAVIMYSGAIIAAYAHSFSLKVILMIPVSIFLMVIEIKRYKKMRVIKTSDENLQNEFKTYAKKIYIIEIAVLFAVFLLVKVL